MSGLVWRTGIPGTLRAPTEKEIVPPFPPFYSLLPSSVGSFIRSDSKPFPNTY